MLGDAAEIFILISGYTAGMVYGRAMERQGFLIAAVRIGHRVWQLYVVHVFLFMIFMATVAYTVGALNSSLYAEEFMAADFLNEPGVAVIKALTLQFQWWSPAAARTRRGAARRRKSSPACAWRCPTRPGPSAREGSW